MSLTVNSKAHLTIPNLITLARILLTPLFIIFLIQERYHWALWIFVLAGVSDLVDGLIARRWRQKSPLGAFLDPLADKLLMGSSFITFTTGPLQAAILFDFFVSHARNIKIPIFPFRQLFHFFENFF